MVTCPRSTRPASPRQQPPRPPQLDGGTTGQRGNGSSEPALGINQESAAGHYLLSRPQPGEDLLASEAAPAGYDGAWLKTAVQCPYEDARLDAAFDHGVGRDGQAFDGCAGQSDRHRHPGEQPVATVLRPQAE